MPEPIPQRPANAAGVRPEDGDQDGLEQTPETEGGTDGDDR